MLYFKQAALITAAVLATHSALAKERWETHPNLFHRRAAEAAIWGMPLVNFQAMRTGLAADLGMKPNDVVYFSRPQDNRLQITTPNNSSLYVITYFSVKDGPVVLEIPPEGDGVGLFGTIGDAWQRPIMDVGKAGFDKGGGGKYLIVGPGYDGPYPDGYFTFHTKTYNNNYLLRVLVPDFGKENLAKANAYVQGLKVYPFVEANNPPKQRFIDGYGKDVNAIWSWDASFYQRLNEMIQGEPVEERDRAMMGLLRTIGIEKGRPYKTSKGKDAALKRSIRDAHKDMFSFVIGDTQKWWKESYWGSLIDPKIQLHQFSYDLPGYVDIDTRALLYSIGFSSVKFPGAGTMYMFGMKDADGELLRGERSYQLTVPANVPVRDFWSLVVHGSDTAAFLPGLPKPGVNSTDAGVIENKDGSVTLYLSPEAPKGKEANWIPTLPDVPYFSVFRFYGPEPAVFDRSYVLPDIEKAD